MFCGDINPIYNSTQYSNRVYSGSRWRLNSDDYKPVNYKRRSHRWISRTSMKKHMKSRDELHKHWEAHGQSILKHQLPGNVPCRLLYNSVSISLSLLFVLCTSWKNQIHEFTRMAFWSGTAMIWQMQIPCKQAENLVVDAHARSFGFQKEVSGPRLQTQPWHYGFHSNALSPLSHLHQTHYVQWTGRSHRSCNTQNEIECKHR